MTVDRYFNDATALSPAQTCFNRPLDNARLQRLASREWNGDPQDEEDLEKGSLFSPSWQARLGQTPMPLYALAGAGQLLGVP